MDATLKAVLDTWKKCSPTPFQIRDYRVLEVTIQEGELIIELSIVSNFKACHGTNILKYFQTFAQSKVGVNRKGDVTRLKDLLKEMNNSFEEELEKIITRFAGGSQTRPK